MYIVGKVLKPRGLKGELKVEIITSFPGHFLELKEIFIKEGPDWQSYNVLSAKLTDRFAFLKLDGVDSVELAEKLRKHFLYITKQDLTALGKDEFYMHDLIGLEVFDVAGNLLGTLAEVESYEANDVYVLKDRQGREYLLPAVKDVIVSISLEQNKMIIRKLDGLME